ncbi:hypothetical protein SUGI_0897960 [Cryptomeria japonica]|nr:hypothetical protein SUGI_0897960 [Cryptomeria japonica]
MLLCFCSDAADEFPGDTLRRSARRGREWSRLRVKEAASTCAQKCRNLFGKMKKPNSAANYSNNQTKSGRFQFACPVAKPRGAEIP